MSRFGVLLRGAAASFAVQIANVALAFFGSAILAQVLAPARFGIFSFMLSLATVLTVPAQFGGPILAIREMATTKARQDWGLMRGFVQRLHQFTIVSSLVIVAIGAVAAFLTPWGRSDIATVAWGLALVPLLPLTALRGGLLRGLGEVANGQWPDLVLKPAVFLAGVGIVLLLGARIGPDEAMALTVLSTVVALIVGTILYRRRRPPEMLTAEPRYDTRRWLVALVPMGLVGGALLVNGQIGILLAGSLAGAEAAGLYRIAMQVSLVASLGYTAVIAAMAPRFSAAHAGGDLGEVHRAAVVGALLATGAALPFLLVFAVAGGPLLRLGFGEGFAAAAPALAVMTLAQVVNAVVGCGSSILIMTGHERDATLTHILALVVHAGLGLLLAPQFGALGVAWAYLGQTLVSKGVMWGFTRWRLGLDTGAWAVWALRK